MRSTTNKTAACITSLLLLAATVSAHTGENDDSMLPPAGGNFGDAGDPSCGTPPVLRDFGMTLPLSARWVFNGLQRSYTAR